MDAQSLTWIFIIAFAIVVLLGPLVIPLLHRFKFGQAIRAEGPVRHQQKSGTPTMGGILFIISALITAWRFSDSITTWLLLLVMGGFGLIGLIDDGLKILRKKNLGLTALQKIIAQVLVVVIFYLALYFTGWHFSLSIPVIGGKVDIGMWYLLFLVVFMVGSANAVNLTDGLDGLATGTTAIAFAVYAAIAWWESQWNVSVFSMAMVGALVGFFVYNRHPAKVFMGDTGSLALGGSLAAVAVLTHAELWLILVGGVFVVETLSVIIQVISFQTTGKRVFKMSPLHHHFELVGWSEWRVVLTFWGAGLLLGLATLFFYIR